MNSPKGAIAMNSIITYLLIQNQYLLQIISYLCNFICKFIPLKQFIFDDSNSPDYQKFKTDKFPVIKKFEKHVFRFLLACNTCIAALGTASVCNENTVTDKEFIKSTLAKATKEINRRISFNI